MEAPQMLEDVPSVSEFLVAGERFIVRVEVKRAQGGTGERFYNMESGPDAGGVGTPGTPGSGRSPAILGSIMDVS